MSTLDDKCKSCKKQVLDDDEAISCDFCDKWWHYQCLVSVKQQQPFAKLSKKPFWYCPPCKDSQRNLNVYMKKHNELLNDVKSQLTDLSNNVDFHNKQFDDLRNDVKAISINVENIKKEDIAELRAANMKLNNEVLEIKSELNIIRQERLTCDAICFGIPFIVGENLMQLIDKLFVEYNLSTSGLIRSRRIMGNNRNTLAVNQFPPIILSFANERSRNQLLETSKKIKIKSSKIGLQSNNEEKSIVIKEMLTKENKDLFESTKKALSKLVKFIWCSKGKIYVRIAEKDQYAKWIKSPRDIQHILDELAKPSTSTPASY